MATAALAIVPAGVDEAGRICAICQTPVAIDERVGPCPACSTLFHDDCWEENGGCARYGCRLVPETVKEVEGATSAAWWGQEEKACPVCAQSIRAAARRCKHCGTVFASGDPTDLRPAGTPDRMRAAAISTSLVVLVTGVFPLSAPVCLALGGLWAVRNRSLIRRLPGTARVQVVVGLVAAALSTTLFVTVALLHS